MSRSDDPAVPVAAIVVLVAAMAAAWIAAGSTGLLAHPLRHALTWVALCVAIVAGWPGRHPTNLPSVPGHRPLRAWLGLAAAVVLGLIMTPVDQPAVNVLAVTLVTAALVRSQADLRGRVILIAVLATAVLAVFRLAADSIPSVWLAADVFGRMLGRVAGQLTGQPLWLGASFGGVDFLVLMAALYAGWLISSAPPRLPRAICAAAAILAGQMLYLAALSFCNQIVAALPDVVLPPEADNSRLGVWAWGNAARTLLPWNLPVLALAIHATIAAVMFRWAAWLPVAEPTPKRDPSPPGTLWVPLPARGARGEHSSPNPSPPAPLPARGARGERFGTSSQHPRQTALARRIDALLTFAPVALALAVALLTVLSLGKSDLSGKTIVASRQGFLDWDRPQYGSPSAGRYGMLEPLVESLGGKLIKSPDLSAEDLDQADILLLLHPNQDWSRQRETLERIWEFVRGGGSLLVVAEPEIHAGDLRSTFNDVLEPTGMRVRQDTTLSETAGWEHSCQTLAHPATSGIGDRRNHFGLTMGSSINVGWPARPLLVGHWAWSEPGSDAVRTGGARYDAGEKLGDLVLAAEQAVGRGTVVVLGDASSLHNDVIANSYPFAGRLLGYLAGKPVNPQTWWRQLLGGLAMVVLLGLLAWRPSAVRAGVAAVVLAGSVVGCVAVSHHAARVLPGSHAGGPKLACIDASHLEAYSSDTWNDFGIAGFSRTLMRCGYLPLLLPELTPERLEHAELLISIGPARRFSPAERKTVRDFVEQSGGTLICMAGAEHAAASRELIEQFGFRILPSPVAPTQQTREAEPLGGFHTLYINTDKLRAAMQSYASWEVECNEPDKQIMAEGSDGLPYRPFIVSRPVGHGTVVVVGDTYLAANQNLESAVNTFPENINFWRWLLTHVTGQEDWMPSPPQDAKGKPPAELPLEEPPSIDD